MLLLPLAFVFAIASEVGHFILERTSYTSVECPGGGGGGGVKSWGAN